MLLSKTQAYAKAKMCNGIGRKVPLAELPQLRSLFEEANAALGDVEAFCAHVEGRLSACLRVDGIPDDHLVQAICITKVSWAWVEEATKSKSGSLSQLKSYHHDHAHYHHHTDEAQP